MSKIRSTNLQKDPMFMKEDSIIKKLKEKQLERQRQLRMKRLNPSFTKEELNIEIFDPLTAQLNTYRDQTSYKKITENSKAKDTLRKYITQQERKLKCLRVQRPLSYLANNQIRSERRTHSLKLHIPVSKQDENEPFNKQIQIPKVEQVFKDQQKQILLHQNRTLSKIVKKAMVSLDNKVIKSNAYSTLQPFDNAKNSKLQKMYKSKNQDDDQAIDDIIKKKLEKSQLLQRKLREEKDNTQKLMKDGGVANDGMNFLLTFFGKIKTRIPLQGIKKNSTIHSGNKKIQVTPASYLLNEMNKLTKDRQRKQDQLSALLKSSYQNRQSILTQKSIFYEKQGTDFDLSPSNQMKLRLQMDRKLAHRLQLSKEQVNKFIELINFIKNQYHVVLNDTILQVLKEVRVFLMSGKTMKIKDFEQVMQNKPVQQLRGYPYSQIIQKLTDIMI